MIEAFIMHDYTTQLLAAMVLLCQFFIGGQQALADDINTGPSEYILSSGDTVIITVADESQFSKQVTLNNTGSFNYPYLGKVEASGLSINELQGKLLQALKPKYLTNPELSVEIFQYHGIYVTGEVVNPGRYDFSQGLTVTQAIAIAGGFNTRADKKKVLLVTPSASEPIETKLTNSINPGDTLIINRGSVFFWWII